MDENAASGDGGKGGLIDADRAVDVGPANTRERIMSAALEQFARFGFETASVREITRAAGVNIAAVNYHFGSKEALYHAVVSRTFNEIRPRRLQLLEQCKDLPDGHPELLHRILYAMIAPHVALSTTKHGRHYTTLLSRLTNEPRDVTRRVFLEDIQPVRRVFIAALRLALPDLDDERLYRTFSHATILMVTSLNDPGYESLSGNPSWPEDPEAFTVNLVEFIAGGLRALVQKGRAR